MGKKFVRGITDIKTINNQDFDTNNVNDLLSDGEHNYIHRKKKDKSEEYHNLTDNIKTISSDNTDLLSVTNYNKSNNSATLHPKHDAQKEQVLESERDTITIEHGANGTDETTKVDTNPEKVLEHTNLLTDYGISKTTSGNTTKLGLEYTKVIDGFDLNSLTSGSVRGNNLKNAPRTGWYFVDTFGDENNAIQNAKELLAPNTSFIRSRENGVWGQWREQVGDKSEITRVEGKIPTNLDALNLMTGTRDWSTKANKWHMGEGWSTESEEFQGLKVHSTQLGFNGSHQNIFVKNGDVVTFSFYAKATNTLSKIRITSLWGYSSVYQPPLAGVKESDDEDITITSEWKRYSKTVHITSDGSLQFRTEYNDKKIPDGNTFYVAGLKLAKTSQDTGYSENPTDTAEQISALNSSLAQKQNTIINNASVGVVGNGLQQLYSQKHSYSHTNGVLYTHVKSVSQNTSFLTPEEEFNFIVKINKGATSATFTLSEHDKTKFSNIIRAYGTDNTVCINGCVFTLSGLILTVSTTNNTEQNYVITFSDII